MAHLCPVNQIGDVIDGVYKYYAVRCPGNQPSMLLSNRARNTGGCSAGGGPGPDCDEIPPPPGPNGGGPSPTSEALVTDTVRIDADLINRGLSRRLGWNEQATASAALIHTLNCRLWDESSRIWRTCRLFLHYSAPKTPAGGTLPPTFFGNGFELNEETIPNAARAEIIDLCQACCTSLGNHLHRATIGGIEYYVLTAG
jgi:hypothetical protein